MNNPTVTVRFFFPAIACEGIGRSSGTMKPQRGFEAFGVEAECDVATRKTDVRWLGRKHGREISDWFWSSDPGLSDIRARAKKAATVAANAVDATSPAT